jgi:hypothetical protein
MAASQRPTTKLTLRTLYYCLILLGMLAIYAFGADPYGHFVYTNF